MRDEIGGFYCLDQVSISDRMGCSIDLLETLVKHSIKSTHEVDVFGHYWVEPDSLVTEYGETVLTFKIWGEYKETRDFL